MAQTFSGHQQEEGEEAASFIPQAVGTHGTGPLWGLELQKLLERLEQGPVWEGPVFRAEERAGGRWGRTV